MNAPTAPPRGDEGQDTSSLVGKRVGPGGIFELQTRAAVGGMGEIWAAWMHDTRNPRRVAVKIIRPGLNSDLSRELFTREMEMHDRVRDVKGVIPLIERGSFDSPWDDRKIYFFAMEWIVSARPLAAACAELTLDKKLALFMRVCETMDVVHKRAIVHCDIKPENILVDEHQVPWLTDFGLAISTRTHERKHTGWDIGSLRGTWSYMAPEQCDERCDPYSFTPALDVYSLGVSLYQCVTGRLPYAQDPASLGDRTKAAAIIRVGPKVPMRVGGRTLPPALRQCLQTALSPRPENRFADAGQLAAELRPMVRGAATRDRGLAGVVAAVCILLVIYGLAPLFNSDVLFSNWYSLISPLASNRIELKNVAIVSINGKVMGRGVENHVDLLAMGAAGGPIDADMHRRKALAILLGRLAKLDVKVVLMDYFMPGPGAAEPDVQPPPPAEPKDNEAFIEAIRAFEGPADRPRGFACLGTRDWRPVSDQQPLIESPLAELAGRAFALKVQYSERFRNVSSEVAFTGTDGLVSASAAAMAAAAYRQPTSNPRLAIDPDLFGVGADVVTSYVKRDGNGTMGPAEKYRVRMRTVRQAKADAVARHGPNSSDPREVEEQFAGLLDDDRLCSLDMPGIPRVSEFESITWSVRDLWPSDGSKDLEGLKDRIVIIGDMYTHFNGSTLIDQYVVPGHERAIFGVELQAAAAQASLDGLRGIGSSITSGEDVVYLAGVPLAACGGIAHAWSLVRRSPRTSGRRVAIAGVVAVTVSGGIAVAVYWGLLWVFNPFVMPATYAIVAGLGTRLPWLRA